MMTLITEWFKKGDVFIYLLVFLLARKYLMEKTVPPVATSKNLMSTKSNLIFLMAPLY